MDTMRSNHTKGGHLIILSGLPGSGKSHLARHLTTHFGVDRICADNIRAHFGMHPGSRGAHVIANQLAMRLLIAGETVCMDSNASTPAVRQALHNLARGCGASCAEIVIDCSAEIRNARMDARRAGLARSEEVHVPKDVLRRMEANFRPPVSPSLLLDGTEDLEAIDFACILGHAGDQVASRAEMLLAA